MAQVFISYSRKDLTFVEKLATDLMNAGLDVWYDVSGLRGGSRWRFEIENAIRGSQFVIIILSPDSTASEWVEREFLFASNLKRSIVPLMYRSCELPLNYLDLNYIDVQGEKYTDGFSDLLRALAVHPTQPPFSPKDPTQASYPVKIAAAVIGVVVIFILVAVLRNGNLFFLSFLATPTSTSLPIYEEFDLPTMITDSRGVEMLLVDAGNFTMGSNITAALTECKEHRSDCQPTWFKDEQHSRVQYLEAFYIDKYEVSNAAYRACEDAGGCEPPRQSSSRSRSGYYSDAQFSNFPVIYVNWDMANSYCQWRSGYLPSEAQWEKAARGTNGNMYPWGNNFADDRSNFCDINCGLSAAHRKYDDGYKDTASVDAYPKGMSPYGAYNMSGNVWEWVSDWYAVYPGGDPTGSSYFEPPETYRVIRGGAWDSSVDLLRATNRDPRKPQAFENNIGFRCARDAGP